MNMLCVCLAFHVVGTELRRHNVYVLFGDVNCDVKNYHGNNKIKGKFTILKYFITCNKNIQIFPSCFALVTILMFSLRSMEIFLVFTSKE